MSKNLYLAAAETDSGKSLIVLGVMNILLSNVSRVGLFRPIVHIDGDRDHDIDLVAKRFNLPFKHDAMYGLTSKEAFDCIQTGDVDSLYSKILDKYKQLEAQCDFVLIEGTDFKGSLRPFEFDFNARVANHLGAPVIAIVNGNRKNATDIGDAIQLIKTILRREKSTYLGAFVNRAKGSDLKEIEKIVEKLSQKDEVSFILPELPSSLPRIVRSTTFRRSKISAASNILSSLPSGNTICFRFARARSNNSYSNINGVTTPLVRSETKSLILFPSTTSSKWPRAAAIRRSLSGVRIERIFPIFRVVWYVSSSALNMHTFFDQFWVQ